jgi:hypothetical protein
MPRRPKAKDPIFSGFERTKAKALVYLEARAAVPRALLDREKAEDYKVISC